jgi:cytochrome c oxidase subunit 4
VEETSTREMLEAGRAGGDHVARHPSPRQYVRIGIVLALVTACEVAVYYLDAVHDFLVPLLLFFAGVKFSLVVLWYMHLKFDSRTYARFFMIGVAGALTLFVIVLLTFRTFA